MERNTTNASFLDIMVNKTGTKICEYIQQAY